MKYHKKKQGETFDSTSIIAKEKKQIPVQPATDKSSSTQSIIITKLSPGKSKYGILAQCLMNTLV